VLVLDEITAFLSVEEVRILHQVVREAANHGHAVLFISHDLGEVLEFAATATVLRDGRVVGNRDARALTPDDRRFGAFPLAPMEMLAACHPSLTLGKEGSVEIRALAPYPLLQATDDFAMRRSFDSACRLAGFTPNYVLECRSPHALLAMAQAGHGVAIIPSALRTHRYVLRLLRVLYRGKPLSEPLTILFDKRRPLPAHAKVFCDMLAERAKKVFPVKHPGPVK